MSAASNWKDFYTSAEQLQRRVNSLSSTNLSARQIREQAAELAETYLSSIRDEIQGPADEYLADLDGAFQSLLTLSAGINRKATYQKQLKRIQKLHPLVTGKLSAARLEKNTTVSISKEDQRIAVTLAGICPSASLSFKQAIVDLADNNRLSYRGPAVELREALRETLDRLAPDKAVEAMPGYKKEEGRDGPTMKQKVRFILKARGMKDQTAPEQAVAAIDEIIGGFARSVYTMSNAATHGMKERADVMRIKRYVVVVLHDILQIPEH